MKLLLFCSAGSKQSCEQPLKLSRFAVKEFKCDRCEMPYVTFAALFEHLNRMPYERFNCKDCPRMYVTKKALQNHVDEVFVLISQIMLNYISTFLSIFRHLRKQKKKDEKIPGELSAQELAKLRHLESPEGDKEGHFSCCVCGLVFGRRSLVRRSHGGHI